jgi:hypothetical protein
MNPSCRERSLLRGALGLVLASSLVVSIFGCSVGVGPPPPPPPPCGEDSTVPCSRGVGWSCTPGADPEAQESDLQCSSATPITGLDTFCCYEL